MRLAVSWASRSYESQHVHQLHIAQQSHILFLEYEMQVKLDNVLSDKSIIIFFINQLLYVFVDYRTLTEVSFVMYSS